MATITFKGNKVKTVGQLPTIGSKAPGFVLTKTDLSSLTLDELKGKKVVLNIFPSIDTGVCAMSVRKFNEKAAGLKNTVVICVSRDLPFAQNRFCGAEGIKNVVPASEYKDDNFSRAYQVKMADGPLAGLFSRAIVVIDESGLIKYTEQVPEITQEPNYEAALKAL
jgi:thioredoxin-dependent peroxiredoxin